MPNFRRRPETNFPNTTFGSFCALRALYHTTDEKPLHRALGPPRLFITELAPGMLLVGRMFRPGFEHYKTEKGKSDSPLSFTRVIRPSNIPNTCT